MENSSDVPTGNNDGITFATDSALLLACSLCTEPIHPPLLLPFRFPCCNTHICTDCIVEYEGSDHAGQSHNCPFCRKQYRPEPERPQPEWLRQPSPGPATPRAAFEQALERQIAAQRAATEAARGRDGGGEGGGEVGGEEGEGNGEEEVGRRGRVRRRLRRLREGVRRRLGRGRHGEEEGEEGEEEEDEE